MTRTQTAWTIRSLMAMLALAIVIPTIAKPKPAPTPAEVGIWSFMIGSWTMDSKRYSLDGPIIEENEGTAEFALILDGKRIQERQSVTFAGQSMQVLNVFAFHPDREQWEVARTDTIHHSFNVIRGTSDEDSMVLFERNPRPDSDVSRRYTYKRLGKDRFSLLLEFSLDKGETWLRRNETIYTRGS